MFFMTTINSFKKPKNSWMYQYGHGLNCTKTKMHEGTKLHEGTKMHKDYLAQRVKTARLSVLHAGSILHGDNFAQKKYYSKIIK